MMNDNRRMAKGMIIGMVLFLSLSTIMGTGSADPSEFIISSTPETTVVAGEVFQYQVEAEGNVEGLNIIEGPEGMKLNNKVLTWTPEHEGNYEIILKATDRSDNIATQFFTLRVQPSDLNATSMVILHPLARSRFNAGEMIEVRGVAGSKYATLEMAIELDNEELPPVLIRGHGDWALELGNEIPPGKHTLTLKVGVDGGPTLNETSMGFEVIPEPFIIKTVYLATPPIYLILLSLIMIAMSDAGIYSLSGIFIAPFYSRIKKEKVLDRYLRGRIFEYIKNNPGATYNNIKRGVSLSNGCLTYHLRVLNNNEMIHSKRNGTFRHFFPKEMPIPKVIFRLSPPQKSILEILDEEPGICQINLARETGMTTTALNYHIQLLRKAEIISVKKAGKETRCYLQKEKGSSLV